MMARDQRLVDEIKEYFARKSSAQLREILDTVDASRWSPEAMEAAEAVLLDREAGRAQEPTEPVQELTPIDSGHDVNSVAKIIALNVLTMPFGMFVVPRSRTWRPPDPVAEDKPVAFGSHMTWLAIASDDTAAVASALQLRGVRESTWEDGIKGAYESSIFVTPPLGEWTLAVGAALFPKEWVDAFVRPLLERLSREFGEAQYFCTHQDAGLHAWARARDGRLLRGFAWADKEKATLWNEGALTAEERSLEFQPPAAGPNESLVMQLAYVWSIDPSSLDDELKEPVMGLLGAPAFP
jgi:hypothetical protein